MTREDVSKQLDAQPRWVSEHVIALLRKHHGATGLAQALHGNGVLRDVLPGWEESEVKQAAVDLMRDAKTNKALALLTFSTLVGTTMKSTVSGPQVADLDRFNFNTVRFLESRD